uniref:Uncharacterized protein n=1 Tax=Rhizophora mucronata TaxID=61149 RepID=A0A2P2N3J0_RHIMU
MNPSPYRLPFNDQEKTIRDYLTTKIYQLFIILEIKTIKKKIFNLKDKNAIR